MAENMGNPSDAGVVSPGQPSATDVEFDFLHEIGSRLAAADPLQTVLDRVAEFLHNGWIQAVDATPGAKGEREA